jgi:hypothetical protein
VRIDAYTRAVLTIIAIALVYLCVVFSPMPAVSAQRGLRPGDDTGPAQVVVVGWRTTDVAAMNIAGSVPLRVSGEVSVSGVIETRSTPNAVARVVLAGWEETAPGPVQGQSAPGAFRALNPRAQSPNVRGIPVTSYAPW